jgi:hypothetical protein
VSLNGTCASFTQALRAHRASAPGVHRLRVDLFRMWPMVFSWRALYVRALLHVRPRAGGHMIRIPHAITITTLPFGDAFSWY